MERKGLVFFGYLPRGDQARHREPLLLQDFQYKVFPRALRECSTKNNAKVSSKYLTVSLKCVFFPTQSLQYSCTAAKLTIIITITPFSNNKLTLKLSGFKSFIHPTHSTNCHCIYDNCYDPVLGELTSLTHCAKCDRPILRPPGGLKCPLCSPFLA